jgi:N-methylhydantoinase B
MPHRDGTNGSGADSAYLKNTPIEINETEVPVRFLRYGPCPIPAAPVAGVASPPSWRRRG